MKALFSVNFSILRDYHGAEKLIRRQLERNPSDAKSFDILSELLSLMGRHDEAIAATRKAVELSPRSYDSNLELGRILYYARRYEEAIAQLNAAVEIDPNSSGAYSYLASSYDLLGRHDAALAPLQKNVVLFGDPPEVAAELGKAYARGGIRGRLLAHAHYFERLANQKKVSFGDVASTYAALGEIDKAFHWLEKAYEEYDSIIFRIQDPVFDGLRGDPRWNQLLVRLHLHDTPLASQPVAPPMWLR